MLPYSVFMLRINFEQDLLEVRGLDPVINGVSFRVPPDKRYMLLKENSIKKAECLFLDPANMVYRKVVLCTDDFSIVPLTEASDRFESHFLFTSDSSDFKKEFSRLLKDFAEYVHIKTENDEISAMEIMTGIQVSDEFPFSVESFRDSVGISSIPSFSFYLPTGTEIAVCLNTRKRFQHFVSDDFDSFMKGYWEDSVLKDHPLTVEKPTHLYIGNEYCPHLFPDIETLGNILDRASKYGLVPVIVFSPIPEYMLSETEKRLSFLIEHSSRLKQDLPEILVNDLTVSVLIREIQDSLYGIGSSVALSGIRAGTLMCKRKKDPRMSWSASGAATEGSETEGSVGSRIYRDHLRSFYGIESFSIEACNYHIQVPEHGTAIHLPYYQLNTSVFCTMYALVKNGNRGDQEAVLSCPGYCEDHRIFYPSGSTIIGRFNSLFGISTAELTDPGFLTGYIKDGVNRLVLE